MWSRGKSPAHITAKMVIASAERLIEVRHFWRKSRRIAEIRVPAWPMPIQKTKFVMSKAQPTGMFEPQTPTPVEIRYDDAITPPRSRVDERRNAGHHHAGWRFSVIEAMVSVTRVKEW